MNPLVSIIIPTYNRAYLIGETLDSIIAQSYNNWECIVVDDGSTDATITVMDGFKAKDTRFQYFTRPTEKLKGANSCRNIGLDKAKGAFIIFFDSDDLMTKDHIEIKLKPLLSSDLDFSITKTKFFNPEDGSLEGYYKFEAFKLTAHNYIVQNINWLTLDVCIKVGIAKKIQFNETLKSGQEYNYFSKLVLLTEKSIFIDNHLSLRRKHEESIQYKIRGTNLKWEQTFSSIWETYLETKPQLKPQTKKEQLFRCLKLFYLYKKFFATNKLKFLKELHHTYGLEAFNFYPMLLFRIYFNKGYYFRERIKRATYGTQ